MSVHTQLRPLAMVSMVALTILIAPAGLDSTGRGHSSSGCWSGSPPGAARRSSPRAALVDLQHIHARRPRYCLRPPLAIVTEP